MCCGQAHTLMAILMADTSPIENLAFSQDIKDCTIAYSNFSSYKDISVCW